MNVLQIVPELNAGGVEATTLEIVQVLVQHDFKAHVLSAGGRMETKLLSLGGILHKSNIGSKNIFTILPRIRLIRAIIRKYDIDIVHARSRAPAWPALFAAKLEKRPFLTTYHGVYNGKSGIKRFYNSVMTKGAHIIANSEFTKNHIIKTHGTSSDKITVIPRGVDMARFDPGKISMLDIKNLKRDWGIESGEKTLLLPGRLTRWKGQLVAIEALAALPENFKLVLLGDAQGRQGYVDELKDLGSRLNISSRLIIPGHMVNVPLALMAADIVISTSTDPEAFGRVSAEAQAMGKPVIATAHGGSLETVIDGETGILVPPSNVSALAQAIKQGTKDKAFSATNARKRISSLFSTQNLQLKTLRVYKDLLK